MTLSVGTKIGPYEIVASVGAGGMGEVYRARDVRLRRDVAIKVLPPTVSTDPERLSRFEREAQTLAALSHPHIATVFGLEEGPDGVRALVMELVEGPTLAEQIARGPLPWREALAIARQIADGLEAAHEKGVIHRDLKPANVKLTPEGEVKILDFGLAKASDPAQSSPGISASPTLTAHATQAGVILGTAAYMAPEQARGKSVDRRADIWSFGCVLYELVTGRRPFDGEDVTEVLARILERDPNWTELGSDTPSELRRLLSRCMTKDPKARLRDIGEARIVIDELLNQNASASTPTVPRPDVSPHAAWLRALPWGVAALFAATLAFHYVRAPETPAAGRMARVEVALPLDVEYFSGPSLSADGSKLAFVGVREGIRHIYVRSLEERETRQVAGTETAAAVSLSPDGGAFVFVTAGRRLNRLVFATSTVEPLADDAAVLTAPAWLPDGSVVYSRGRQLVRLRPDGTVRELTEADSSAGEVALFWPVPVTGERTVLFSPIRRTPTGPQSRLEAIPDDGGKRQVVLDGAGQPVYATNGRIVFVRDHAVFRADFDASRMEIRGTPVRVAESITKARLGGLAASVAPSGALVSVPPSVRDGRLVWVSNAGVERPVGAGVRGFSNPRVSPDGRLIAFEDDGLIWTFDPERGTFTRVYETILGAPGFPCWSPDSKQIYISSGDGIRLQNADGEGVSTLLPNTSAVDYPTSVSPDGSMLVLLRLAQETGGDIYMTPAGGGELTPLLVTNAYEGGAQISPDGKWLLYVSNESGRMEVYLRPMRGPDRKWAVSSDGGLQPIWSPNGRSLFYRSGRQFLAVDVTTNPEVKLSRPQVLFEIQNRYAFGHNLTIANYSLGPVGREFLMVQEGPGGRHLNLVLNWLQSLGIPGNGY